MICDPVELFLRRSSCDCGLLHSIVGDEMHGGHQRGADISARNPCRARFQHPVPGKRMGWILVLLVIYLWSSKVDKDATIKCE